MSDHQIEPNILPLVVWPDNRLNVPCVDVEDFGPSLHQLVVDMFATMEANEGIGLAAPQVGVHQNVVVLWLEQTAPMVFINPTIVTSSEELFSWEEGCLSVPGYFEERKRPKTVVIQYKDASGSDHEVEFHDLYAFAIQHEIDHLRGRVFVDGASTLKQFRIKNKIKKTLNKRK